MEKIKLHIKRIALALLTAAAVLSCTPDWTVDMKPVVGQKSGNQGERAINDETRKVLILYSAGFNSISSYLKADIEDLKKGWIPSNLRPEDVILIYSHFPNQGDGYKVQTSPTLTRVYCDRNSTVVTDTLKIYPAGTISASAIQMNEVLTYIRDYFPAKSYGMIFSSHATGYLPSGYYQNPGTESGNTGWMSSQRLGYSAVPYVEPEHDPSLPMVKSVGQDQIGTYPSYTSYEMELTDFAEAIPMYLDYLLFDACLMGGIEVAYELRDKVGKLGFSQTEVLAEGYCYESITSHLLQAEEADPESVCRDFFNQYDIQTGVYRSATVSYVDCSKLDPLAECCKELFAEYSKEISALDHKKVQKYYRSDKHWFYDLESILVNAGINNEELAELQEALDHCIIYKAYTPRFMNEFDINTFSGFSMYLPCHGSKALDTFYKGLKWNIDTGLVN